jgi:hypothetical protein
MQDRAEDFARHVLMPSTFSTVGAMKVPCPGAGISFSTRPSARAASI